MALHIVEKDIPDVENKISIYTRREANKQEIGKGIELNKLKEEAKDYLEKVFQTYLKKDDLKVSQLACSTDWEKSSADSKMSHFFIEGRFVNFPINNRVLSGRLTTILSVRKNLKEPKINPDDQNEQIILLIDDLLSPELRDSTVINHIKQNYNNPIDIIIKKERLETYPEDVYCYVSVILDNILIKYLRVVFKIEEVVNSPFEKITIKKTSWSLKRADEINSCEFPSEEQIKRDTEEQLYDYFLSNYNKNVGKMTSFKHTSHIKSFTNIDLIEANDELIKLEIDFIYSFGMLLKSTKYGAKGYIKYKYNYQRNKFEHIDKMEIVDSHVVK
jgi:hypothetical protein